MNDDITLDGLNRCLDDICNPIHQQRADERRKQISAILRMEAQKLFLNNDILERLEIPEVIAATWKTPEGETLVKKWIEKYL